MPEPENIQAEVEALCRYKVGDTVWFIGGQKGNRVVCYIVVASIYVDCDGVPWYTSCAGISWPATALYPTREEAEAALEEKGVSDDDL